MRKNNILLILKWLPYPLSDGGKQAIFNAISAINNFSNIYITYLENHSNKKHETEFLNIFPDVKLIPFQRKKTKRKLRQRIINYISIRINKNVNDDISGINDFSNEYLTHINSLIEDYKIEIVQIEMLYNASIVLSLPQNVKKIFIHHEIGFVRNKLYFDKLGWNNYRKVKYEQNKITEIGILNKYDAIITLSTIDSQKLQQAGVNIPIYSSFATITPPKHSISYITHTSNKQILSFIGPSTHEPNVIGVHWFLENCWDSLLKKDSSYKLQIIGKWNKQEQDKILKKYKSVEFLGYVENLAETIKDTTMIVPITIGSGIRMKLQEAALNLVPFVSTTVGAEGLPFVNEIHGFIEDNPKLFIEKILMLKNEATKIRLTKAAYTMITEQYSIKALQENRLTIIKQINGQ